MKRLPSIVLALFVRAICPIHGQELILPDVPVATLGLPAPTSSARLTMAAPHDKFILPEETAPHLTAGNKVAMGLIHGASLDSVAVWLLSSGYSHVLNSAPNYGTDSGAYGQRLGASALRGYTEETIGTSVLAPLLHQDPRFYKMGPRRNLAVRAAYAVTRTVVTRTDSGHLAPNYSLVGGNLAGATLTNAYYPNASRTAGQTLSTFGGSMGGAAFAFFAAEFFPDRIVARALARVHLVPGSVSPP